MALGIGLALALYWVAMALGPTTAGSDHDRLVLGNQHLVSHKGDYKVGTASNVRTGRLVARDGSDKKVKAAADGANSGLVGWVEARVVADDGSAAFDYDRDSDFSADDIVHVLGGPGVIVNARLANGENVTQGDYLVPAAGGELKAAATLSVDSGTTAVTSTAANGEIIAGSVPRDGAIVAKAHESVDASGGAADIAAEALI